MTIPSWSKPFFSYPVNLNTLTEEDLRGLEYTSEKYQVKWRIRRG